MDPGTRVAGGDGEPGLQVAGVEGRQLFLEGHHHQSPVGAHVGYLGVELDVLNLEIIRLKILFKFFKQQFSEKDYFLAQYRYSSKMNLVM